MPILSVSNLSVAFKNQDAGQPPFMAVKDISFSVEKGEVMAIVGESGSGKSVTALSILQLLPYPLASHPSGSIQFKGKELVNGSTPLLRAIRGNKISMVFQEPMTSLNPLHSVYKQISEPLRLHHKAKRNHLKERVIELLEEVELSSLTQRIRSYPHELSGGQRQRVMIAMALAAQPEILIADEPTTALDVTVQASILKLLKTLQQKRGMAMILITHDLTLVRKIADRVAVMKQGRIVEQGHVETIFSSPQHAYTKKLLNSELLDTLPAQSNGSDDVLTCQHINVRFPLKKNFFGKPIEFLPAVQDISFTLKEGKTLGIVGESGSGKTTLAMAVLRLTQSNGEITFNHQPIHTLKRQSLRELRQKMQIVFQDPFASLNPRMTIAQIIEEGLKAHNIGKTEKDRLALVTKALDEVGLSADMHNRYPHEFSGGQRQRIAIARALVLRPRLIVLDEPTSALDLTVQKQIIDLLKGIQKKHNVSLIFISHDLRVIRAISHHVIVMKDGTMIEQGETHHIFDSPQSEYTKSLIEAAFKKPELA